MLLKCYILNTVILCINAYHISSRMRKKTNVYKMSFCMIKCCFFVCLDLVVISLWSSHKKNLKAPSKGSAVEKKTSAPLAHTFHTVITSYFDHKLWSKFSITCCHFKQSFRGLCRFHCQFLFIWFFISKTYLKPAFTFLFRHASFKCFKHTFSLYFYLEECTR